MSDPENSVTTPRTADHALDARHQLPIQYLDVMPDDLYAPINGGYQLDGLIGKVLTLLDATGMPPAQGKAVKDLVKGQIRDWYAEALDNAETSFRGCIAPIVALRHTSNGTERKYVWLAEGNHAVSVS